MRNPKWPKMEFWSPGLADTVMSSPVSVSAVYALWRVPHLVPHFLLKAWEVSKFVVSGADLMLPGVQVGHTVVRQPEMMDAGASRPPAPIFPLLLLMYLHLTIIRESSNHRKQAQFNCDNCNPWGCLA